MFDQSLKLAMGVAIGAALAGVYVARQPGEGSGGLRAVAGLFQPAQGVAPARPAVPAERPPALGFGRIELPPDRAGQYHARVEIEGRTVPMLVDTGATLITLTFADAQHLGLAPAPSDYTADVLTANGPAKAARVSLREVRVQNLLVRDVPALVMPASVAGTSLLGMSFLQRLGGFEIAAGNLVLRP